MPKKKSAATSAKPAEDKVAATKPAASTQPTSKAAFVRSQPEGLSAKEIVARAKAAGLTISANHVYAIRPAGKRKRAAKAAPAVKSKRASTRPARATRMPAKPANAAASAHVLAAPAPARSPAVEAEFIRVALDLGRKRVEELLAHINRHLGALSAP